MYCDLTLRDGSHAIKHQITEEMIIEHCKFAEDAGIGVVEVGHGNGLGASSILIGESLLSDFEMLSIARKHLKKTKLSVHFIPGLGTIKDINLAISLGVDIFRVASYCTETSLTKTHIEYLSKMGKCVYGVIMMSASCSIERLHAEACNMKSYGASAIVIMDSSGSYTPNEVTARISKLMTIGIPIGFHGHNNLHLAVANSLAAIQSGASIIDVTVRGFGAGAGNTPLETMIHLHNNEQVDKIKVMKYCENTQFTAPSPKPINILTAMHKLFSGFEYHITKASTDYNISYVDLINVITKQEIISGQEDFIYLAAHLLKTQQNK